MMSFFAQRLLLGFSVWFGFVLLSAGETQASGRFSCTVSEKLTVSDICTLYGGAKLLNGSPILRGHPLYDQLSTSLTREVFEVVKSIEITSYQQTGTINHFDQRFVGREWQETVESTFLGIARLFLWQCSGIELSAHNASEELEREADCVEMVGALLKPTYIKNYGAFSFSYYTSEGLNCLNVNLEMFEKGVSFCAKKGEPAISNIRKSIVAKVYLDYIYSAVMQALFENDLQVTEFLN
ncbi:hypothetical protein [uncultured Thalassospira sp.]|uniref:hypothetical protein n=1 Tax=uncultured Thalassospira sp. TaxID=404382 RepID=UPI00258784F9|nr:hypothetical protein [uncultured Thalassospira sp.]